MASVFNRSAEIYDAIYGFKDYRGEAEQLHALIERRVPGAASLLDVACGTGKHLEQLQRWYEVEGVDLDDGLLSFARARLPGARLTVSDMTAFDLGRSFDAVTCLFSSVGYLLSLEHLRAAVRAMAAHLRPGGVLIVEPWITPEAWRTGEPHLLTVDQPELKIARINVSGGQGRLAVLNFSYLVGRPSGVEHFTERHETMLFTHAEVLSAFEAVGLTVEHDTEGLIGRGLYIGCRDGS